MKSLNLKLRAHLSICLLLLTLAAGSACSFETLTAEKNASAARTTDDPASTPANAAEGAGAVKQTETSENTDVSNIEGTYNFTESRAGKDEKYENSLIVERAETGKIRVSFEGAFVYRANGAETFHDSSAYGTLFVKGNTASGKITEEGTESTCAIELNFASGERVNLKSSNCDLRVTPDGVYRKGAGKTDNLDADAVDQNKRQNSSDTDPNRPFIQYDQTGEANGIVNLMERTGERTGCEEDVMNYTGEVVKVDYIGDYVYEFTLASDNRRPQKISLALAAEDRLPFDDVRSIIRRGNHLEVTFIYCGNAGIATPTAVYKR